MRTWNDTCHGCGRHLRCLECNTEGEGYIDIEQAHRITQVLVTAWVGQHLKGDDRYAPWLEADARAVFPELSWEQE